jgi:hypothetical protein
MKCFRKKLGGNFYDPSSQEFFKAKFGFCWKFFLLTPLFLSNLLLELTKVVGIICIYVCIEEEKNWGKNRAHFILNTQR